MEFLKAFFGGKALTYDEFVQAINAYNGTPENKEKQVKLANLGEGGYVSKDKYAALETTHNSKLAELEQANNLITDLQKSTKGNEELQVKIQNYDNQVKDLQTQLEKAKLDAAIKVALLEAKAQDIDYLTFKLNEEKNEFKLDENGKVKGLDEKIEGLKIKFPTQFEAGGDKKIIENKLPGSDGTGTAITKEEFAKMGYKSRVELKEKNPELYSKLNN